MSKDIRYEIDNEKKNIHTNKLSSRERVLKRKERMGMKKLSHGIKEKKRNL